MHSCLDDKSNPISKSNDKFINRDNNRNSNRNTTAVAITIALATAIANANEHTKIVRITFVWGPRAGIIFLIFWVRGKLVEGAALKQPETQTNQRVLAKLRKHRESLGEAGERSSESKEQRPRGEAGAGKRRGGEREGREQTGEGQQEPRGSRRGEGEQS